MDETSTLKYERTTLGLERPFWTLVIISILVACEEVFFNYFLSILGRYEFAKRVRVSDLPERAGNPGA